MTIGADEHGQDRGAVALGSDVAGNGDHTGGWIGADARDRRDAGGKAVGVKTWNRDDGARVRRDHLLDDDVVERIRIGVWDVVCGDRVTHRGDVVGSDNVVEFAAVISGL